MPFLELFSVAIMKRRIRDGEVSEEIYPVKVFKDLWKSDVGRLPDGLQAALALHLLNSTEELKKMEKLVADIKTYQLPSQAKQIKLEKKRQTQHHLPLSPLFVRLNFILPPSPQPPQIREDGELNGYNQSSTVCFCCSFLLTLFCPVG